MVTFQVDFDVCKLPGPVLHAQGYLDLGHGNAKGALPILLSAHAEPRSMV